MAACLCSHARTLSEELHYRAVPVCIEEDVGAGEPPCRRLTQLSKAGDAAVLQAVIRIMQGHYGRDDVASEIISGEFGGRGSKSALHHAAMRGRAQALRVLLEAGGNPDALDDPCNTPLHLAAAGGHARATYLLLQAGANPNLRNAFGTTPLAQAEGQVWDAAHVLRGKANIREMLQLGIQCIPWEELPPEDLPIDRPFDKLQNPTSARLGKLAQVTGSRAWVISRTLPTTGYDVFGGCN